MLKKIVKVLETYDHQAKVSFHRGVDCQHCLSKFFCNTNNEIIVNTDGFEVNKGDNIEVGVESRKNTASILLIFVIPLVIFVSVLFILKSWGEARSFLGAIFLVGIYYLLFKWYLKDKGKDFRLQIIRKL